MPQVKSLRQFIAEDRQTTAASTPGTVVAAAGTLSTADGQQLPAFTFFPKSAGNWELVAYGEEGDYFLIFTLSARSQAAYRRSESSFKTLAARDRPGG